MKRITNYKLFVPDDKASSFSEVRDIQDEIEFLSYLRSQLQDQRKEHDEVIKAFRLNPPRNKFDILDLVEECRKVNDCDVTLLKQNFPLIEWGKYKAIYRHELLYGENIKQIDDNIALLKALQIKGYDLVFSNEDLSEYKHRKFYKYFRGLLKEIV